MNLANHDNSVLQACTQLQNQTDHIFECVPVEQALFLPRTYIVIGLIILSTLLVLFMQHRYFSKFDED